MIGKLVAAGTRMGVLQRAASAADVVRQAALSWNNPVARLRRQRKRARWALTIRTAATVGFGMLAAWTIGAGDVVAGSVVAVFVLGLLVSTVGSARHVWRLERTPLPDPPPPFPPPGSQARAPMERLAARERTLGELLIILGPAAGDTAAEARDAAGVLRARANRLVALEAARRDAPDAAVSELTGAIETVSAQLADGVAAYERLVAAAASAVSAFPGDPAAALTDARLRDATDALAGLAAGLREVKPR